MNPNIEFSRQPRFMPEMPGGTVEIPNPPHIHDKPEIGWFSLLAPPAVMLIITFLLALSSRSEYMMISIAVTVMTLLVSLTGATSQIKKYKKKKKEREVKYLQFITDTRSDLTISRELQVKGMNELNPEPSACIERIKQIDNKLWERTPSHHDFLSLRLGVGSVPSAVQIKYTKQAVILESDPLLMEPQRLALEFERVQEVPVAVNLLTSGICGIAGEDDRTANLITLMLLQLVTHHGYDDVKVVVLASQEGIDKWNWLKGLPHLWDDGGNIRFLMCGKDMGHQLLGELNTVFKHREMNKAGGHYLPHYVFVIEDTSMLEGVPIHKYLFNRSVELGVSSVFIAKNKAYLPMNCQSVITLQGKTGELADRLSGEKSIFSPDQVERRQLEQAARILAPLRIKNANANYSLPNAMTLMEMLQAESVAEVNVYGRWMLNKTFKGISVPIGAKAGGALFNLDLHETGHGPHGLVAGTTGSGKSELLQSMIISLAMNYHPHDVVFVLIDYKGGGMADIFNGMPHLVGTITNLGGNQTTRALLSIKSELMRRQRIFSEYGVNNIDRYQKQYYSQNRDRGMPAIPHLVMIADEFAELKQDQPDFMKELISTARVGRSLGIHLILATQKPAGIVDDQIWSNSKFKICLKVQDEADSKDVIKRPDAAMIKEPGRAYIQVGNDEIFELFQSAYSGADYDPEGELQKSENQVARIYQIALDGRAEQIYPLDEEKIAKKELPTQLKAMVDHIVMSAKRAAIVPLVGPWLPPLPETLQIDELYTTMAGFDYEQTVWAQQADLISAPIGLMDDPRGQRQEPLMIDLAGEGNLFVYGSPGTGKTVLLKTLCMSLAHRYSPRDVHIYIMDFGGASFKLFERLPHCGGVITLEQEESLNQFVLYLFRMIEERKKLLEETKRDSYYDYKIKGGQLPAIVVVIDNYFALSETYESVDEKMVLLAREGTKYGIFMVVTASNASLVRYKLAVNFKMAISLQMTEKSEYDGIVGRTEGLEPAGVAGRALVRHRPPLEFQTALPAFRAWHTEEWIDFFDQLAVRQTITRAAPIPIMPASLDIQQLNEDTDKLAIGLGNHDLQPVLLDLAATPVIMVAGDAGAGKSTLLVSWVKVLVNKLKRVQIYALDSSAMGIYQMMTEPHVTDLSSLDDMEELIERIKEELDLRRSQLIQCRMSGGNLAELMNEWSQIVFVIDRLSELTSGLMYNFNELLERIVKQERGMKVAIIAADNTGDLASNWDSLGKAMREEQTGVLLGRMRDQSLYSVNLPYGVQEQITEHGDGYLIVKHKYTGLRYAMQQQHTRANMTACR